MIHLLKTDPYVFGLSMAGLKPWEIRKDDRGFVKGDTLVLKETAYSGEEMTGGKPLIYTGREIESEVVEIIQGYGLLKDWVVMTVCHLDFKG